jgi:hypothetical protein
MTEPSSSRPVPGPPRWSSPAAPTGPGSGDDPVDTAASTDPDRDRSSAPPGHDAPRPYADLDQRPVAEHVEVFEAEHARLQDELSTIDRL